MASGSEAAAGVSVSTTASGAGATGSPIADASWASTGLSVTGLSMSPICRESLTSFCSEVMMLPLARPVAASLTSSKLFLMSAISASRIASWNWPWNSAAILRALPIHCPTMRSTPGNSFGPMAISATTAMTTSSLHPISNMKNSAHARRFHPNACNRIRGRPRLSSTGPCRTPAARFTRCGGLAARGSDSLAADVGARRRGWRCVVVDRLHGLGLFRSLVIVLHALLEGLDALRDVAHQIGNLAATEQQQDDCDHDDPVPNAKRTHPATLQTHKPETRPNLPGK